MTIVAAHHVGLTVSDLERSATFWGELLGVAATSPQRLEGPGLGRLVGYPGARAERAWVERPGVISLELVRYRDPDHPAYQPGTAHPGSVHVSLLVDDMASAYAHALGCGAEVVGDGWIEVPAGPLSGSRIAYLRDPDGITLELIEPA
jgi:catechol 2,3-dioxygenase-like lactoylglutathione lyase family enzyme